MFLSFLPQVPVFDPNGTRTARGNRLSNVVVPLVDEPDPLATFGVSKSSAAGGSSVGAAASGGRRSLVRFVYGKWVRVNKAGQPLDLFEWLNMDLRHMLCHALCTELLLCDPRAAWFHYAYISRNDGYLESCLRDPRWYNACVL